MDYAGMYGLVVAEIKYRFLFNTNVNPSSITILNHHITIVHRLLGDEGTLPRAW